MIIDNTYFKDEIYIPHAKPSITDNVTTVSAELNNFIAEYSKECLLRCLGYPLFKEFTNELDPTQSNGLKTASDAKWNDLLNGKEYISPGGESTYWRGIRYKLLSTDKKPTRSFLANYVYFKYEQSADVFRSGVGHVKTRAKNSHPVSPAQKTVAAWRKMVEIIQGKQVERNVIITNHGVGVDYFNSNAEKTLYGFIKDMNALEENTYSEFKPSYWENINQFGI